MAYCPKCGVENKPSAKFCASCGAEMPRDNGSKHLLNNEQIDAAVKQAGVAASSVARTIKEKAPKNITRRQAITVAAGAVGMLAIGSLAFRCGRSGDEQTVPVNNGLTSSNEPRIVYPDEEYDAGQSTNSTASDLGDPTLLINRLQDTVLYDENGIHIELVYDQDNNHALESYCVRATNNRTDNKKLYIKAAATYVNTYVTSANDVVLVKDNSTPQDRSNSNTYFTDEKEIAVGRGNFESFGISYLPTTKTERYGHDYYEWTANLVFEDPEGLFLNNVFSETSDFERVNAVSLDFHWYMRIGTDDETRMYRATLKTKDYDESQIVKAYGTKIDSFEVDGETITAYVPKTKWGRALVLRNEGDYNKLIYLQGANYYSSNNSGLGETELGIDQYHYRAVILNDESGDSLETIRENAPTFYTDPSVVYFCSDNLSVSLGSSLGPIIFYSPTGNNVFPLAGGEAALFLLYSDSYDPSVTLEQLMKSEYEIPDSEEAHFELRLMTSYDESTGEARIVTIPFS